jgi:uncharacterized protein YbcI
MQHQPATVELARKRVGRMSDALGQPADLRLTEAISAAIVELYAVSYGPTRTTATTYLNSNIVVCVLESILTAEEDGLIADGSSGAVIDGRVAFQTDTQDEFTDAVERLTNRHVTAFLSANQTTPGVACELFFLDAPPLTDAGGVDAGAGTGR